MNITSILKGRIAESIIDLMLEESGYQVFRIAQEGVLSNLPLRNIRDFCKSNAVGKITKALSFAVIDRKQKDIILIKIRFRSQNSTGRNIAHGIKQIQKHWPEAFLVVVNDKKPYFTLIDGPKSKERVIENVFPRIKKETLRYYEGVVKDILK